MNGEKQDNRPENLILIDPLTHKRTDSRHYRRDVWGDWERLCGICEEWKPADRDHFYTNPDGWILYGRCRPCHIERVVKDKKRRRELS